MTLSQFATARLRVRTPDGVWADDRNSLYGMVEVEFGHDESWGDTVIRPDSGVWFHLRDERLFEAGTWVLIEAAIQSHAWFDVDDYSVTMSADLDSRLDWIKVRSGT